MRNEKRRRWLVLSIILVLAAAIAIVWIVGGLMDKKNVKPEARGDLSTHYDYMDTITVNGKRYRKRNNITTVLLMGIDHTSDTTQQKNNRNGGQADFLRLIVLDGKNKTITQLPIDRDTITDVVTLGVLGNRSGTRQMQISLSHGFGDGGKVSSELTAEAVSNLLSGVQIDYYLAMNMDGINQLNDALGGVTVQVEDDLSHLDAAMVPGATVTLQGKQAETFVRSRMSVADGTNTNRMKRQQQFMSNAMELMRQKIRQDQDFAGKLLDKMDGYITTNMSRADLINESYAARDYTDLPSPEITGKHQRDEDGFMEFYPDEDSLIQIVLSLFYDEIK